MTKLFVPKHVRQEQEKSPTEQPQEISELELKMQEKAAQAESDVVDLPILEKLPQPTGWRVLILPYRGKGKTEGGLFIPDATVDREALTTVYQDTTKFGLLQEPWCKENDWVIFGRYAGSRFKIDGGEVRLLNDDEILAKIQNPEDIIHL